MEKGEERQTRTRPIQGGPSHPRRSGRPSGRAQARSRTPSSPVTSQQSQPSRAQALGHEPVPSEPRGPGPTPGPDFFQEAASRTPPRGTLGASHRACREGAWASARMCVTAQPTYRHSPRHGRAFLFFLLVALALPLAQGPLPTFVGPGGGVSVLRRSSRSCSCAGSLPFLPPPRVDW